jgi:hypothetical protein
VRRLPARQEALGRRPGPARSAAWSGSSVRGRPGLSWTDRIPRGGANASQYKTPPSEQAPDPHPPGNAANGPLPVNPQEAPVTIGDRPPHDPVARPPHVQQGGGRPGSGHDRAVVSGAAGRGPARRPAGVRGVVAGSAPGGAAVSAGGGALVGRGPGRRQLAVGHRQLGPLRRRRASVPGMGVHRRPPSRDRLASTVGPPPNRTAWP